MRWFDPRLTQGLLSNPHCLSQIPWLQVWKACLMLLESGATVQKACVKMLVHAVACAIAIAWRLFGRLYKRITIQRVVSFYSQWCMKPQKKKKKNASASDVCARLTALLLYNSQDLLHKISFKLCSTLLFSLPSCFIFFLFFMCCCSVWNPVLLLLTTSPPAPAQPPHQAEARWAFGGVDQNGRVENHTNCTDIKIRMWRKTMRMAAVGKRCKQWHILERLYMHVGVKLCQDHVENYSIRQSQIEIGSDMGANTNLHVFFFLPCEEWL